MCKNTDGIRPCPYVSCSKHLIYARIHNNNHYYRFESRAQLIADWLDSKTDDEILDMVFTMPMTCIDDVSGCSLEDLSVALGVSRQRVEQILTRRPKESGRAGLLQRLSKNPLLKQMWEEMVDDPEHDMRFVKSFYYNHPPILGVAEGQWA